MTQTENPVSRASHAFDDYRRAILLHLDPAARAEYPLRFQGRGNPTPQMSGIAKWRGPCASKGRDILVCPLHLDVRRLAHVSWTFVERHKYTSGHLIPDAGRRSRPRANAPAEASLGVVESLARCR